jgi:mono/diheme cytochrome c family protein
MKVKIGVAAAALAVAACDPTAVDVSNLPTDAGTSVAVVGRRLASESCAPCHGVLLTGDTSYGGLAAPSLAVVRQYSWDQFNALFDSGLARDGQPAQARVGARRAAWAATRSESGA